MVRTRLTYQWGDVVGQQLIDEVVVVSHSVSTDVVRCTVRQHSGPRYGKPICFELKQTKKLIYYNILYMSICMSYTCL